MQPPANAAPLNHRFANAWGQTRGACSLAGQWLAFVAVLLVLLNHVDVIATLNPFHRIAVPTLCLLWGLLAALHSTRLGLMACVFALPLIPNFAAQFQAFTGYGRIAQSHNGGLDLIAGLLIGTMLHRVLRRSPATRLMAVPWPVGLVMIFLTISVSIAIARNLHQSSSSFDLSVLGYNLLHLRTIDWHDDYRPLFDWVAYGVAFAFIGMLVPALKASADRNDVIFRPLVFGLVIAAIVGIFQSQIGIGLDQFQLRFRPDRLGFMAVGLQPDLHAYAGHMLIGALGLFGYAATVRRPTQRIILYACVIPLSWIGLVLSKSKASLALALFFLLAMILVWQFRRSRHFFSLLKVSGVVLGAGVVAAVAFRQQLGGLVLAMTQHWGITNFSELNVALTYRPENFMAALRMLQLFPVLGLGQGEFYRQSANYQLSQSYFLAIEQNGENAHNYFLQTLAETGLVGGAIFALMLIYPFLKSRSRHDLLPAAIGLGSVFVANLFAHSMLVRENLFVAASLLALLYAWSECDPVRSPGVASQRTAPGRSWRTHALMPACVILAGVLALLSAREVARSFSKFPFTFDTQCYKSRPLDADGWMTGLYEIPMPPATRQMTFEVKVLPPDIAQHPLAVTLSIVRGESEILATREVMLTSDGPFSLPISLPGEQRVEGETTRAVISLGKCFIPRNMGINADGRRLGIQLSAAHPE